MNHGSFIHMLLNIIHHLLFNLFYVDKRILDFSRLDLTD